MRYIYAIQNKTDDKIVWFRKFPAGFVPLFPAIPVVKCKPSFFEIALRWFMRVEWVHSQPR